MTQGNKKKQKAVSGDDLQKQTGASANFFLLLSNVFDPRNVPWIAIVIITLSLPTDDRKDVAFTFINQGVLIIAIVILFAIIIIMAVVWFFTHRLDKIEIDRVSKERDELQRKLGSPIQSSEQQQ